MFSMYHNGVLFYDDTLPFDMTAVKLNLTAGGAGSLTFTMPMTNPSYDTFNKLTSYVDLYRNDDLIFCGRVIEQYKDFQGMLKITCEGLLAVFNDSFFTPATYESITLSTLVNAMLASHNAQVGEDKQVTLGTMTVTDGTIYRAYEEYNLTIDRLKDLVDSYGGYMSVRKTNGTLYLDWLAEYTDEATQSIDFGYNMLDLTQESTADEIVTVLLPLGSEIEDSEGNRSKVTVASVNDGKVYIENASGIAEFGRVVGIKQWDDVTVPSILLSKATEYLNDMRRSRITINVKAVDMAKAGSDIESFTVGQKIYVSANMYDVNDYFVALTQSLDILNPANNQMTLGNKKVGYIGQTRSAQNQINHTVNVINAKYASGTQLDNRYSELQESLIATNATIESSVTTINADIDEVRGSVTDAITTANTYTDGKIEEVSSEFVRTDSEIMMHFTDTINDVDNTFTFDANGLTIRDQNSRIYSQQGADYYKFVDADTDTDVFKIDESGTTGLQSNVTGQIGIGSGSVASYVEQWAIRKGAYDSTVGGYDLQIVWIGG